MKGIERYGDTIDKSNHLQTTHDKLEYALEEATDLIVYLEHISAHIKSMELDIYTLLSLLDDVDTGYTIYHMSKEISEIRNKYRKRQSG